MEFSIEQQNFFKAVRDTRCNIALLATAGSGKTTTIIACLPSIPRNEKTAFFSFSNAIVKTLWERVPVHMKGNTSTLHSRGLKFIKNYLRRDIKVADGGNKYFNLALDVMKATKKELTKKDFRACYLIQDVAAYARQTLTLFTQEDLIQMCAFYNIEFDNEIIDLSIQLLEKHATNTKANYIDFVDMIYWPAVMPEMVNEKFMTIFLDEAQDTNKAQLLLIENMLTPQSRLISVGDDFQCIYGFSGADVDAFKRIRERPNTMVLPLSVTYRCPKAVVRRAQLINPDIQAYEGSKEGTERQGDWTEIREGDMVLSRITRPLIALYFQLIDKGVKAHVVGKDIEKGLISLTEQCMSESFEGMKYKIEVKRREKEAELLEMGVKFPTEHAQFINFEERIQVLTLIMKKCDRPSQVLGKIREVFHEDKHAAQLMTIHRSKGLEAERVFIIEKADGLQLMPSKYAKQKWEFTQETNLIFVATTRPKSELVFVSLTDI